MENLEEVLQALDEFQKMRPSEIPRELEEYLCWVAKTGDPVYQWSLIKTLFREKLTRVMTDFYESCPSLELAPCPNVEHFNYDTMKSNLLERLESFANAPFTVQRICELLTAPRKEYNRVDKFMRAIEKNILVVSTREPGPIARRSENGDGMVNGSVDEDASVTQPSQDVEMEYWEKDCPSTVTISVHTVENEAPLLHTVIPSVIPTTAVVKNVFGAEENSHEKLQSVASKSEIAVSSFIPTTSEFSGVPSLTPHQQSQETPIGPTMQNLSTIVPEASGIVGDVPEAIMNEDTSSQPSLDLENEEGEGADSNRKLQTTFQAKDFACNDSKSSKFYLDNSKPNEKEDEATPIQSREGIVNSEETVKIDSESIVDSKESVSPIVENLLKTSDQKLDEEKVNSDSKIESMQTIVEAPCTAMEDKEEVVLENTSMENTLTTSGLEDLKTEPLKPYPVEKNPPVSPETCQSTIISATGDPTHRIPTAEESSEEATVAAPSEDMSLNIEELKDCSTETNLSEDPKPIVEEPPTKDNNLMDNISSNHDKNNLTITEAVEDEARVIKSMVPDPIPIVEEPKDTEAADEKLDHRSSSIVDVSDDTGNQSTSIECQMESEEKLMSVENSNLTELQGNKVTTESKIRENDSTLETNACKRARESVELMEVDEEETLTMFQQEEPMEQETAELSKS